MISDNDAAASAQFAAFPNTDSQSENSAYVATKVQHGTMRNLVFFDDHVESQKTNAYTVR